LDVKLVLLFSPHGRTAHDCAGLRERSLTGRRALRLRTFRFAVISLENLNWSYFEVD
jgi:hypothetical protein